MGQMQQPKTELDEAAVILDAAVAHARAAGALATLSLAQPPGEVEPLARALDDLVSAGDTRATTAAAAGLTAARHAAGTPLTTHTLRLVAEALADPDAAIADGVEADLRRAALRTPRERAPLANAFSGLSLLTRALAARTGRDFTLTVDASDALACADQLDPWRHAAMLMAEFILERATEDAVAVALVARESHGAISLSADLPPSVRVQPAISLADALLRALDEDTTESMVIDTAGEFTALEAAAADLGGSIAVETLADGAGQRLVLLAGRPAYPPFRPTLRTVSSRPVRRAARAAA
jgi:hypothetical protein